MGKLIEEISNTMKNPESLKSDGDYYQQRKQLLHSLFDTLIEIGKKEYGC